MRAAHDTWSFSPVQAEQLDNFATALGIGWRIRLRLVCWFVVVVAEFCNLFFVQRVTGPSAKIWHLVPDLPGHFAAKPTFGRRYRLRPPGALVTSRTRRRTGRAFWPSRPPNARPERRQGASRGAL
jgi:hypothetical protein